jgi:hypothetical protein
MRKITISLTILIALTIKLNAQIPNSGFETWTTIGSYENPTGWATTNSYSTGSFYAVTKSIDHYPTSVGTYSIRIENNTAFIANNSGLGFVLTGSQLALQPAFPITGHPNSLTGYYKYTPINSDTMDIGIQLYKNGVQVSGGDLTTTLTVSNWTSFNIPLSTYTSADSGFIVIQAYHAGPHSYNIPHGNSVLYVDNLNFDNLITSVSEQTVNNTLFNLYPNPASNFITLNIDNINNADLTLNIYNVIGTLVKSETLKQNQRQINVGDLSNGVYMVTIKSKDFTESQRLIIQK